MKIRGSEVTRHDTVNVLTWWLVAMLVSCRRSAAFVLAALHCIAPCQPFNIKFAQWTDKALPRNKCLDQARSGDLTIASSVHEKKDCSDATF